MTSVAWQREGASSRLGLSQREGGTDDRAAEATYSIPSYLLVKLIRFATISHFHAHTGYSYTHTHPSVAYSQHRPYAPSRQFDNALPKHIVPPAYPGPELLTLSP